MTTTLTTDNPPDPPPTTPRPTAGNAAGPDAAGGDAAGAAATAARDALLRCWVRETGVPVPDSGEVAFPLPALGLRITVPVRYRSPTGCHHFGAPRLSYLDGPDGPAGAALDPVTLAALLARQDSADPAAIGDLVGRVAESARRIGTFLDARRRPEPPDGDDFLDAEQALLLGHLLHPAAKSRDGLSDRESARYSPELRGRFPLHWFAVDRSVLLTGAAPDHPALVGRTVPQLLTELSELDSAGLVVPAHPWQARDLLDRPEFAALLSAGLVRPLGAAGPDWSPTSSLRTVYRPGAAVMLKLSLGLRITNSRRENTLTELRRGIEVHRLLSAGHADEVFAAYPGFRIVRDPAFAAVVAPDGGTVHLDVSVREVPAGLTAARCLAGLTAPRPGIGPSQLVRAVDRLAATAGRDRAVVAAEWIGRYVDRVLAPMVHLYARTGIGLEAHQQNTLVLPDADGWPAAGWYRDNQGYYLAESRLPSVLAATGEASSTLALAPDSIVDDRLTYYLLFNQLFAPVAALGTAGVADEVVLLRVVRDRLAALVARGHDTAGGLVARWLDAGTLPCKANLATRLAGIDEVLAPVDNQSVYVAVPNPLHEVTR
jgi:siderophore synthetase component